MKNFYNIDYYKKRDIFILIFIFLLIIFIIKITAQANKIDDLRAYVAENSDLKEKIKELEDKNEELEEKVQTTQDELDDCLQTKKTYQYTPSNDYYYDSYNNYNSNDDE